MFSDIAALKHQVQIIKRQAKNNKKISSVCFVPYRMQKTDNEAIKYYDKYSKKTLTKLQYKTFQISLQKS